MTARMRKTHNSLKLQIFRESLLQTTRQSLIIIKMIWLVLPPPAARAVVLGCLRTRRRDHQQKNKIQRKKPNCLKSQTSTKAITSRALQKARTKRATMIAMKPLKIPRETMTSPWMMTGSEMTTWMPRIAMMTTTKRFPKNRSLK